MTNDSVLDIKQMAKNTDDRASVVVGGIEDWNLTGVSDIAHSQLNDSADSLKFDQIQNSIEAALLEEIAKFDDTVVESGVKWRAPLELRLKNELDRVEKEFLESEVTEGYNAEILAIRTESRHLTKRLDELNSESELRNQYNDKAESFFNQALEIVKSEGTDKRRAQIARNSLLSDSSFSMLASRITIVKLADAYAHGKSQRFITLKNNMISTRDKRLTDEITNVESEIKENDKKLKLFQENFNNATLKHKTLVLKLSFILKNYIQQLIADKKRKLEELARIQQEERKLQEEKKRIEEEQKKEQELLNELTTNGDSNNAPIPLYDHIEYLKGQESEVKKESGNISCLDQLHKRFISNDNEGRKRLKDEIKQKNRARQARRKRGEQGVSDDETLSDYLSSDEDSSSTNDVHEHGTTTSYSSLPDFTDPNHSSDGTTQQETEHPNSQHSLRQNGSHDSRQLEHNQSNRFQYQHQASYKTQQHEPTYKEQFNNFVNRKQAQPQGQNHEKDPCDSSTTPPSSTAVSSVGEKLTQQNVGTIKSESETSIPPPERIDFTDPQDLQSQDSNTEKELFPNHQSIHNKIIKTPNTEPDAHSQNRLRQVIQIKGKGSQTTLNEEDKDLMPHKTPHSSNENSNSSNTNDENIEDLFPGKRFFVAAKAEGQLSTKRQRIEQPAGSGSERDEYIPNETERYAIPNSTSIKLNDSKSTRGSSYSAFQDRGTYRSSTQHGQVQRNSPPSTTTNGLPNDKYRVHQPCHQCVRSGDTCDRQGPVCRRCYMKRSFCSFESLSKRITPKDTPQVKDPRRRQ